MVVDDPTGPETNHWLNFLSQKSEIIIAIWGNKGKLHHRNQYVLDRIMNVYCLGVTKLGEPKHPLFINRDSDLNIYLNRES